MSTRSFDPTELGAIGDGVADDFQALYQAFNAAITFRGHVRIPAGRYRTTQSLEFANLVTPLSVTGAGPNVATLISGSGQPILILSFKQDGIHQPYGLNLEGVGFLPDGPCASPLIVSYGNPTATSDHYRCSTVIRNCWFASDDTNYFTNGPKFEAAWNVSISDCVFSGRGNLPEQNWNLLSGNGVSFTRMCVNTSFINCRFNFWATGVDVRGNTEGLFFSNCSMVAVKRGHWVVGDPADGAGRMSTFTWTGGMIELRVKGTDTGSAGFHLVNVWSALITGCQVITDAITPAHGFSYGAFLDHCRGIVVTGCDLNAVDKGVFARNCVAVNVHGNTSTNTAVMTELESGTILSRSHGNIRVDGKVQEIDQSGMNQVEFRAA
jgi:hypothetical protein